MADINVYGTLKTMAEDQKVAYANCLCQASV